MIGLIVLMILRILLISSGVFFIIQLLIGSISLKKYRMGRYSLQNGSIQADKTIGNEKKVK